MDPIRREDETPSGPTRLGGPLAGMTVLVVEDEPMSREALILVLESYGADVVSAGSVPEALGELDLGGLSVLISDIGLPGEDGLALIRRIRRTEGASPRRLPAIALSGFSDPSLPSSARVAGFDHFLPKPVDVSALVSAIERLVGRRTRL